MWELSPILYSFIYLDSQNQKKIFLLHFIQRSNRQTILGTFKNIFDGAFMQKELMVRWKKAPS